jgi:hypothetical protein
LAIVFFGGAAFLAFALAFFGGIATVRWCLPWLLPAGALPGASVNRPAGFLY